jgi:hypothetical protein
VPLVYLLSITFTKTKYNMFNFFSKPKLEPVGSIIVCIDDRDWNGPNNYLNLVYGKFYKVLDKIEHPHYSYDIGGRFKDNTSFTRDTKFTDVYVPGQGIHWACYKRFRKATEEEERAYYSQEKENTEKLLKTLVKEEKYEEAAALTKKLQI